MLGLFNTSSHLVRRWVDDWRGTYEKRVRVLYGSLQEIAGKCGKPNERGDGKKFGRVRAGKLRLSSKECFQLLGHHTVENGCFGIAGCIQRRRCPDEHDGHNKCARFSNQAVCGRATLL
jgi:hypothetical protein